MITLVITNRNRDLRIVKKSLDSLQGQTNQDFVMFFVDYGSSTDYLTELESLLLKYPKTVYIKCPVSGQLWNKSRAINIALKKCTTPYFMVADIDMLFRNDFMEKVHFLQSESKAIYFKVGFLSEAESRKVKTFEHYEIKHCSTAEATGITLYPTEVLKAINGYDEFYHGWGAEDTDVHMRLQHAGHKVQFYDNEILLLHQWHPKIYRSKASKEPFHFNLEKINHSYLQLTQKRQSIKANVGSEWGLYPEKEAYARLDVPSFKLELTNEKLEVDTFLKGAIHNWDSDVLELSIKKHILNNSFKNRIRKVLGKKYLEFYTLDHVNCAILETLITSFRNHPHHFDYSREKETIILKIKL